MNKRELVRQLSGRMNCKQSEALLFIEEFIALLSHNFIEKKSICLTGFGSFTVRRKSSREVLIPGTDRRVTIVARNIVFFKVSKRLLHVMNPV